jgi:hypothetical protein
LSNPITIFSGATGLNTVESPERIAWQRGGVSDLQAAVNVTIDSSRMVKTRPGSLLLQSGDCHSLYSDGNVCFVMMGTALYGVAADGSLTGIRSGMTAGARTAFWTVGERTYYCNGFENGVILGNTSSTWPVGTYTGPESNRQFSAAPVGHHLALFGSRMFISEGRVLWWSEPHDVYLYNLAESFVQFRTKILMIRPVTAGLFISTEKRVVFLRGNQGNNPKSFTLETVTDFPAIEWTDTGYYNAVEVGFEDTGLSSVWATKFGAFAGLSSGGYYSLNRDKVVYPDSSCSGFGCLMGYHYIHGIN